MALVRRSNIIWKSATRRPRPAYPATKKKPKCVPVEYPPGHKPSIIIQCPCPKCVPPPMKSPCITPNLTPVTIPHCPVIPPECPVLPKIPMQCPTNCPPKRSEFCQPPFQQPDCPRPKKSLLLPDHYVKKNKL